jgi:hypothetical protein
MDKQMFCKYCGKKIEVENAIFCTGCGKRLDDAQQAKPEEEKEPVKEEQVENEETKPVENNNASNDDDPKKPVSIVKVALIVFGALLAISLIGFGIYKLATRSVVEDEVTNDDGDDDDDITEANPTDTPDEPEPTKEPEIISYDRAPDPTEPVIAASVPGSDDTDPNGLHIYKIVIDDVTWEEACRDTKTLFGDEGGYLVHINTQEEYDYIVDFIEKAGYEDRIFWIGAKREESPAVYKWVDQDGNLVGDNLNNLEYWLEGEPSFYDDSTSTFETCVEMFYSKKNKKWVLNDVQNDVLELLPSYTGKMGYIIEID